MRQAERGQSQLSTVAAPSCGQRLDIALSGTRDLLCESIGDERTKLYTRTTGESH